MKEILAEDNQKIPNFDKNEINLPCFEYFQNPKVSF